MLRLRPELDVAPRLIASSVVRGARLHESHGGLCTVDFATGAIDCVLDWNSPLIDVEGRGGDRGLRGIGVAGEKLYALASEALLVFDRQLRLEQTLRNRYLKHCHELFIYNGQAFVVSTGFDAILTFDLATGEFIRGVHLRMEKGRVRVLAFDPRSALGPAPSNDFHLNSVVRDATGLYFAGLRTGGLLCVQENRLTRGPALPEGTHNAQPFYGGVIYNDTACDRICAHFGGRNITIRLSVDAQVRLDWVHADDPVVARPLFARGLCPLSSRYVVGGSSPSTVTLYDLELAEIVAQASLSIDVRNAIHGLAVWPFQCERH